MKLLSSDWKQGQVTLQIETPDDLWYLSHLIDVGDTLSGKTFRKIKIGSAVEGSTQATKKTVFLILRVEKIEYTPEVVRALGPVLEGIEDVPKGSYHSFSLEIGSRITIKKSEWLSYQRKKLHEACEATSPVIRIVVHDREEAYFALMKKYGYEILSSVKGDVAKKEKHHIAGSSFYQDVLGHVEGYDSKYHPATIIIASPAFFKEDLMKQCKSPELRKKILLATCNHVGKTSFDEVLKRDETKQALAQDRINKELKLVDQLLTEIAKENLAVYGLKETQQAADAGAIATLLVTYAYIQELREKNAYTILDKVMKSVDSHKGEIHIINAEHEGGKKLHGLGGIGGILRYRLSYT